jgi:hypothetical protein
MAALTAALDMGLKKFLELALKDIDMGSPATSQPD